MDIANLYQVYRQCSSVKTDTRKLEKGDLFIALKGPSYNGNSYIPAAFAAGAAYCITDEEITFQDERIIRVNDGLETLQALAKFHRQRFKIPFIAITGSNGKTTTKELVHQVLSMKLKCYTTEGNLNNHIGVPLTILKIKDDAEIAVIEMGANHQKEIEAYCLFTLPTHGNITNAGKAHLEGFGSEEGVRKGKGELFSWLRKNNGTAFINIDYPYLVEMAQGIDKIISYGSQDADFVGNPEIVDDLLCVNITKGAEIPAIKTQLVGAYNFANVLTAVCIGKTFGVDDDAIKTALEAYSPSNSRSQLIVRNGNKIILDAYNANPTSMEAAIENFAKMDGTNKVLILGGMMELGHESKKEHDHIMAIVSKHNWTKVVLAGEGFQNAPKGFIHFETSTEVADWFKKQHFAGAQVLIKGSRGMQMEKVLE